jgi:hypothetical protein
MLEFERVSYLKEMWRWLLLQRHILGVLHEDSVRLRGKLSGFLLHSSRLISHAIFFVQVRQMVDR